MWLTSLQVDGEGTWLHLQGEAAFGYCRQECPTTEASAEGACPHRVRAGGLSSQLMPQDLAYPEECAARHAGTHKKVLFLGNSYTGGNNLKNIVADIARGAGFYAEVSASSPGGKTLTWHAANSLDLIRDRDWDAVVLQDQSQRPSFGSSYVFNNILPDTVTLVQAMRAANPCTVPIFYQTWGKRDGDTNNCQNGATSLCTFEGIQDQLTESYNTFAYVNQPAKVAPAGEAWRTYSDRNSLFGGE